MLNGIAVYKCGATERVRCAIANTSMPEVGSNGVSLLPSPRTPKTKRVHLPKTHSSGNGKLLITPLSHRG
jgi:hypothetical protein